MVQPQHAVLPEPGREFPAERRAVDVRVAFAQALPGGEQRAVAVRRHRPAGVRRRIRSCSPATCWRAAIVSSVSIQPGKTALTWMLSLAQAVASERVNCTIAPLLAEYAAA